MIVKWQLTATALVWKWISIKARCNSICRLVRLRRFLDQVSQVARVAATLQTSFSSLVWSACAVIERDSFCLFSYPDLCKMICSQGWLCIVSIINQLGILSVSYKVEIRCDLGHALFDQGLLVAKHTHEQGDFILSQLFFH